MAPRRALPTEDRRRAVHRPAARPRTLRARRRLTSSASGSSCCTSGVVEQVAHIALREHTVTQQCSDLGGDDVALLRRRLLTGGQCVSESNSQLAGAGIARRFDRTLNEREMRRAVRLWIERIRDRRIDDVRIAASKTSRVSPTRPGTRAESSRRGSESAKSARRNGLPRPSRSRSR